MKIQVFFNFKTNAIYPDPESQKNVGSWKTLQIILAD
jgi:hypothetical protein